MKEQTFDEYLERKKLAEYRFELYRSMLEEPTNNSIKKGKIEVIRKKKLIEKRKRTEAAKKILSAAMATIIFLSGLTYGGYKIYDHVQEQQAISTVEDQRIDELSKHLESLGVSIDDLNKNIDNKKIVATDENLYSYYLIFSKKLNLPYLETYELMNELAKKMRFDSFGLYLKNRGYINLHQPYAPSGDSNVWININEAEVIDEAHKLLETKRSSKK